MDHDGVVIRAVVPELVPHGRRLPVGEEDDELLTRWSAGTPVWSGNPFGPSAWSKASSMFVAPTGFMALIAVFMGLTKLFPRAKSTLTVVAKLMSPILSVSCVSSK